MGRMQAEPHGAALTAPRGFVPGNSDLGGGTIGCEGKNGTR